MRYLVIDDMREFKSPPDGEIVYVKTAAAAVRLLRADKNWDHIYLDHDLGYNHYGLAETIRPVVDFIEGHSEEFGETEFFVITSNPYGGDSMMRALQTSGLKATRMDPNRQFHYLF